ncbi:MAG: RAD55 family ATPase [Candidatus Hydrothermarchaeales archaeon]
MMERIKTGIPKLDDKLGGGVPTGRTLCYYIEPGAAGEVFGMQTLASALKEGREGIFVSTHMEPNIVREQFKEYGWGFEGYGDRFFILDAYSGLMGLKSDEGYLVENPNDIDSINDTITQAIEDLSPGGVIYASLSQIMDFTGADIEKYVSEWNKRIMHKNAVGVYNFTAWPYPKEILAKAKEEFFNCVVQLRSIGNGVPLGQYYEVAKADWCDAVGEHVLFRTMKPGGVKTYEPTLKKERLKLLISAMV